MGTLREKTPICISGWIVTRACSTSKRAMAECTVTDPPQRAATDTVPEVTALVVARVPDIRTSLLILNGIKKREGLLTWQRRRSTSTLPLAVSVRMHPAVTATFMSASKTMTPVKRATEMAATKEGKTKCLSHAEIHLKMGKTKITELRCKSQLCGCVETGLSTSAALASDTTTIARLKCHSGKSQRSGMMQPSLLIDLKMAVDQQDQVPLQLTQEVGTSELDIPVWVSGMICDTDQSPQVLHQQTNSHRNCQKDLSLTLWMHPIPPPPLQDLTLCGVAQFSEVTLLGSPFTLTIMQDILAMVDTQVILDIQATRDTRAIQSSKETVFITVHHQGSQAGGAFDMRVRTAGG